MNTDSILSTLTSVLANSWWGPIHLVGYLIGFFLVISGLVRLANMHRGRDGLATAILRIVSGILLLNLMSFLNMLSQSTFGENAPTSALEYAPSSSGSTGIEMQFVFVCIEIIGLIGIIRGLVLMAGAASEPRNTGRAFTHIIGGILALNMTSLLAVIGVTLGSSVNSAIQRFIH